MMREQEFRQDNFKHYIVGLVVFIIALALGIFVFFYCVQETIEEKSQNSVMDALEQQQAHFHSVLDVQTEVWEAVAKDMSYSDELFSEENLQLLYALSSGKRVERAALVSLNGKAVFDSGETADLSDADYVKEALAGKTVLKAPIMSEVDGALRIVFGVPVQRSGEIKGVFCVSYDLKDLSELIVNDAHDGSGTFLLVTDKNEMISFYDYAEEEDVQTKADFFAYCNEKTFLTGSLEQLQNDFDQRKKGVCVLTDKNYDITRYLAYQPLDGSQWMTCYTIPTENVQNEYAFIKKYEGRFVFGYIIGALLLFIWILLVNDRRQRKLLRYASMDALTNVFNKVGTEDEITYWLNNHARAGVQAFLMLDIDKFKDINDEFGHSVGDEVLRQVGATLQNHFRGGDIIGRIGGDEFVVMMTNVGSKDVAVNRAKQLSEVFKQIQLPEMNGQPITCSMGIAFAPQHGESYLELYKCADVALYETKRNGRDGLTVYC